MKDKSRAEDGLRDKIKEIESKIGYVFNDKSLLIQSFTRSSYCNEHRPSPNEEYQSNEVLEFFGDGVLSAAVISCLLEQKTARYPYGIKTRLTEGDFSMIKSRLSDKKNLSECTKRLGLQVYLQMGDGDKKLGINREPSVMEDLFESIVGAVYIDSGMNMATVIRVVKGMLDVSKYLSATSTSQSAKNLLQEFCADKKRKLPQPEYKTVSESGPDHKKVYVRGVYLGERLIAVGEGKNQKLADTEAAANALSVLKKQESDSAKIADADKHPRGNSAGQKRPCSSKSKDDKSRDDIRRAKDIAQDLPEDDVPELSFAESLTTPKPRKEKARSFAEYLERLTAIPAEKQTNVYNYEVNPSNGSDLSPSRAKTQIKPETKISKAAPVSRPTPEAQSAKTRSDNASTSSMRLKAYAQSKKLPTPTYSDLGQSKENGRVLYRVECRFNGVSEIGTADNRLTAKNSAADRFLKKLREDKRPKGHNAPHAKTKRRNG